MGVRIPIANADYSARARAFAPPVTNGLVYWNYFGTGKSLRNLTIGGPTPSFVGVGSVVESAGYVSFNGVNAIDTTVLDAAAETILVVARWPAPIAGNLNFAIGATGISALNSARTSGAGADIYYNQSTDVLQASIGRYVVATQAATAIPAAFAAGAGGRSVWGYYGMAVSDTAQTFQNSTTGISATSAASNPRDVTRNSIRIGGNLGVATGVDIAFAAIYSRALSAVEIAENYAAVKTYLATQAITV